MPNKLIDQRKAIERRFKAGFVAGQGEDSLPPVQYENQPFKQPSSLPWCRLSIASGDDTGLDIGSNDGRIDGVVFLQVFIPENGGVDAFHVAADKFATIFNLQTLMINNSVLRFRRAGTVVVGKDADTGMFQRNASIEFQQDTYTPAAVAPVRSIVLSGAGEESVNATYYYIGQDDTPTYGAFTTDIYRSETNEVVFSMANACYVVQPIDGDRDGSVFYGSPINVEWDGNSTTCPIIVDEQEWHSQNKTPEPLPTAVLINA